MRKLAWTAWALAMLAVAPDLSARESSRAKEVPVRNVIYMIGDGMGLSQIVAAMFANKNLTLMGLKNIGLGARDTLRLEMGFCLYGNDIDDTTSPIEAGLNWLTKFVDGKEFIDRKLMEEQKAGGLTRKLVGFKMIDRGIPRHGYQIASPEGDIIGQVTSGTMSPCLKQGIGMGYVKKEFAKVGTQIAIVIREKLMKAEVVKLPFIQQK